MDRLLVFHQIFDKELNVHGFLNHEFPFIFASLICIHIFISKNHPSLCCDLVKARPSTGKPGWLRLWMIKYAWLANEVSATDNTPLCANLCKFLTDTLIKSRQSLTEIGACKHVIVCIVHTEATRTSKEWKSINRNNKLIQTGDLRSTGEFCCMAGVVLCFGSIASVALVFCGVATDTCPLCSIFLIITSQYQPLESWGNFLMRNGSL